MVDLKSWGGKTVVLPLTFLRALAACIAPSEAQSRPAGQSEDLSEILRELSFGFVLWEIRSFPGFLILAVCGIWGSFQSQTFVFLFECLMLQLGALWRWWGLNVRGTWSLQVSVVEFSACESRNMQRFVSCATLFFLKWRIPLLQHSWISDAVASYYP